MKIKIDRCIYCDSENLEYNDSLPIIRCKGCNVVYDIAEIHLKGSKPKNDTDPIGKLSVTFFIYPLNR